MTPNDLFEDGDRPQPWRGLQNWHDLALPYAGERIGLLSGGLFIRNRTTIIPHGEPVRLVTDGPFRFTRNPMYVSLNLAYVGILLVLSTLWPLVLLPIPFLFLNQLVIPYEERRLAEIFGSAYSGYSARVRRWI
jgi:protein-S-isoprenylcysteine O-methyltransferase Ste14